MYIYAQGLPIGNELQLAFGTGNSLFSSAHEIVAKIGTDKSRALPLFNVLTKRDTIQRLVLQHIVRKLPGLFGWCS